MVVGVLGEVVANPVALGAQQERVPILHQPMEGLIVQDHQDGVVTHKHVQVM